MSAETQQAIDAAYKGTFGEPPTSGPRPQAGKNVWVIMASAQVTDLTAPGQIQDAAKILGWNLKLFDGKFSPDQWVSGVQQAIAAKADGIILYAVDCAAVKAALQEAQQQKIPVVGWEAVDCDQTVTKTGDIKSTGQPALFSASLTYPDPADPSKELPYAEAIGREFPATQVLSLTAGSEGKGKIIKFTETDLPITVAESRGFDIALKQWCPDCEVVEDVQFTGADYGPPLQDKAAQAIAQHPEANVVYSPFDGVTTSIAPAVVASGRKDSIFSQGGEGTAAVADLVREGRGVNAGVGYSVDWEGWAAMDSMNRLINGDKPSGAGFPSGLGMQIYDQQHNLPPKGQAYQPPVDFRAGYQKIWGG